MPRTTYQKRDDPLSRLYREQVDMSLLRANLRLSVEQRLDRLVDLQRFAHDLREACVRARRNRPARRSSAGS